MSETISKEEHEKVVETLHEEILKRDKIIDKLKEDNKLLIKTSLKRADAFANIQEKVHRKI